MMCDTIEEAAAAFAADKEAYPMVEPFDFPLAGEFTGRIRRNIAGVYYVHLFPPADMVIQDEHIGEMMMISWLNEYDYVPSRLFIHPVRVWRFADVKRHLELLHARIVDAMLPQQEGH